MQAPGLMQQGLLADYIVAKQLFAFWLPDMCCPGSPAQQLFWQITGLAWQQQSLLSVMGYYPPQEVRREQRLVSCTRNPPPCMLLCEVGLTRTSFTTSTLQEEKQVER